MTGRHEAPPLGSAARDATAPPYHGRHRAPEPRYTERGFRIYAEFTDRYGHSVRVQESSLATEPAVWIFAGDGGGAAHLTVLMAAMVHDALGKFIREHDDERAERVADERWSDPEDTHQGGPDDV